MTNHNTSPHYSLAIFDFDGTLADTAHVILSTMKATFSAMNLPLLTDKAYLSIIGLPLVKCFTTLVPTLNLSDAQTCTEIYHNLFPSFDTKDAVKLYPQVREQLLNIHSQGVDIAIASSRNHHSLKKYLQQFQLTEYVTMLVGADDVEHSKPHPEPVLNIMAHYGRSAQDTLVIGDAPYDILMGKRAGCKTCGVTYGNSPRHALEKAGSDYLIDDFQQLSGIIIGQ